MSYLLVFRLTLLALIALVPAALSSFAVAVEEGADLASRQLVQRWGRQHGFSYRPLAQGEVLELSDGSFWKLPPCALPDSHTWQVGDSLVLYHQAFSDAVELENPSRSTRCPAKEVHFHHKQPRHPRIASIDTSTGLICLESGSTLEPISPQFFLMWGWQIGDEVRIYRSSYPTYCYWMENLSHRIDPDDVFCQWVLLRIAEDSHAPY